MISIHKTHVPLIMFTVSIMVYAFGGFLPDAYSQGALPENDATRHTGLTGHPLDNDSSIRQTPLVPVLSETAPPQKESGTTESAQDQERLFTELSNRLRNTLDKDVLTIAYKGLEQSQKNIDRSISILNWATGALGVIATILGIIVAIFGVIIAVAGLLSYFKYKDTRELEKQIEQNAKKANNVLKEAEAILAEIEEIKKRAKDTVNSLTKLSAEELSPEESKQKAKELEEAERTSKIMGIEQSPAQKAFIEATKLYYQGNYQDSLKELEKAINLKHDFPDAWYSKGVVLGKLGKYEEALKEFDKVLELKPDYHDAWLNKGYVLAKLGRLDDALKAFDQAISHKPDYPEAWNNRGYVLAKLDRLDDALKAFDQAISHKPDYPEAWHTRGYVLNKLRRPDDALKAFDQAIRLKRDDHEVWLNKAISFILKNDKQNMLSCLAKAIEFDPKCKQRAKDNKRFESFRNDPDFKKLVE